MVGTSLGIGGFSAVRVAATQAVKASANVKLNNSILWNFTVMILP
jgi:hypothetical protein